MSDDRVTGALSEGLVPFGYMSSEHTDESPGLYSFWVRGTCLYVGMSMNIRRRLRQHCESEDNGRLREYFEAYGTEIRFAVMYHHGITEPRLRRLESRAIRAMRPLANRQRGGGGGA